MLETLILMMFYGGCLLVMGIFLLPLTLIWAHLLVVSVTLVCVGALAMLFGMVGIVINSMWKARK